MGIHEDGIDFLIREKERLADALNIAVDDLPDLVVIKAVEDPVYLYNLITSKNCKEFLSLLFSEAVEIEFKGNHAYKNKDLLKSFLKSMKNWGASNFNLVSEETRAERLRMCLGCDYLDTNPDGLLYMMLRTKCVCKLCGCDVYKKSWLKSEKCPDKQYGINGRWKT